jgi:hypothetical protein
VGLKVTTPAAAKARQLRRVIVKLSYSAKRGFFVATRRAKHARSGRTVGVGALAKSHMGRRAVRVSIKAGNFVARLLPLPKPTDYSRAIKLASSQIGVKESPAGSNCVKFNTWYYGRVVSGAAYSWCACFVSWVLSHLGIPFHFAYVPAIVNAARNGQGGLSVLSPAAAKAAIRQGKIVLACYDWPGESPGLADHIGIVKRFLSPLTFEAIEGNTAIGNDSNGGEVMLRQRSTSMVQAFVLVETPSASKAV